MPILFLVNNTMGKHSSNISVNVSLNFFWRSFKQTVSNKIVMFFFFENDNIKIPPLGVEVNRFQTIYTNMLVACSSLVSDTRPFKWNWHFACETFHYILLEYSCMWNACRRTRIHCQIVEHLHFKQYRTIAHEKQFLNVGMILHSFWPRLDENIYLFSMTWPTSHFYSVLRYQCHELNVVFDKLGGFFTSLMTKFFILDAFKPQWIICHHFFYIWNTCSDALLICIQTPKI